MKRSTNFALAICAGFLLGTVCAHAEDIDIFSGAAANGAPPGVLIILDNASAWDGSASYSQTLCPAQSGSTGIVQSNNVGKDVGFEQCALYLALQAVANTPALVGKINMGLMMFGSNQLGGTWGGIMRFPNAQPYNLPLMDGTLTSGGIGAFATYIKSINRQNDNANSSQVGGAMYEAYSFFTGRTSAASGITYSNHLGLSCQRNFIIYIGNALNNGKPQDQGQHGPTELAQAVSAYSAPSSYNTQINTLPLGQFNKYDSNYGDEWSRFLFNQDFGNDPDNKANIITYTISVTDGTNPDYVQSNKSMALQGGGKYFVVNTGDVSGLVNALLTILNEVAAVSTVFASASLPVNANTQGTYANQVYIGMFRTDPEAGPRWIGNLKQYQFGVDTTTNPIGVFLADSTGTGPSSKAISGAHTGFFSPTAISFWTSKNTSTLPDNITTNPYPGFWGNNPQGVSNGFDLQDGEIVEKGGVHQQIRLANLQDNYATNATGPRNMYTCVGTCASGDNLSSSQFATTNTNLTNASFNITSPTNAVSSISRNGTTVTMTLAAAPSPALVNGQNVTVQGAANSEINGNFTIALVNATTFTYTITESPVTPSAGTYTASIPSNQLTVTSLVRGGGSNAGTTVTVTTSSAHGYVNGDTVTISGATGAQYNGPFVISNVTSTTFQYTISDSPALSGGGGTATVGTSSITIPAAAITRTASNPSLVSVVTVNYGANLPNGKFQAGQTVTIAGSTTGYNGSFTITDGNANGACGVNGGGGKKVFCFNLTTTPVSPDTGANKKVDRTASVAITGLSHPAACTSGSAIATVTATTTTTHPFVTGDSVSVAGSPVGTGEAAYVGTFSITKVDTTHFTYTVTTTPPCTPSASGVAVVTSTGGIDKNSLINWVRGDDNVGDERSPGNGITVRPSVHGDVLHSRPAVINYGSSVGTVVFYGANDGTYRAVNGNQTASIGSTPAGGELWSFVPSEFFTKLPRLYLNSPMIKLASTPSGITPTPLPKDYFFDGSTGVYQLMSGGTTTKAYLFLSARRGGRLIYAIDVTDPTTPKFMWKIGCPNISDNVGCTSGFSELGQTWSLPKVASVKGNANPVLIFGGGYDPNNEDLEPPTADTMGRAIFIVDAVTGAKLWQAGGTGNTAATCTNCNFSTDFTYAMPADITLVDRDSPQDGMIDRLYAADLGGNVWRVDLEPAGGNAPANWQVTKFASVGGTGTTKRKMMYPPDIVATANFDAIMFATGDREHPLYSNASLSIVNRFYMVKDTKIGKDSSGWTAVVDSTSSTADVAPSSAILFNATSTQYPSTLPANGFYITLQGTGEKAVNAPTTFGGVTYFGTNTPTAPSANACTSAQGTAKGYQVNFITGASTSVVFDNRGLPPSPVTGVVNVATTDGNGNSTGTVTTQFCIGCGNPSSSAGPDGSSIIGGGRPPIPINPVRKRVFWFLEKHDK